jgi:hypothetical protein
MVELILSEPQLACLKAAVTIGSETSAALGRGGNKVLSPEPFAVRVLRRCRVADPRCDRTGPRDRSNVKVQAPRRAAAH